jgi:hypothetical protein
MKGVRPFTLVFLVVDADLFQEGAPRELSGALHSAVARGLLDFLGFPPTARSVRFANDSGTRPLIVYGSRAYYTTTTTTNLAGL